MTPDESNAALKELLLAEIQRLDDLLEEKDKRYADLVTVKTQGVLDLLKEKDALYTDRDTARQKAVEAALKAAQTGVDAAFAASEKAIGKSDQNAEKWRENANEWRAAMQDREIKFAGRIEVDNELKNLRTELASVKEMQAEKAGKGSASEPALAAMMTEVHANTARLSALSGQSAGFDKSWAIVLAVVGLLFVYLNYQTKTAPAVVAPAPQVIYIPAPAGALLPTTPPATVPR